MTIFSFFLLISIHITIITYKTLLYNDMSELLTNNMLLTFNLQLTITS